MVFVGGRGFTRFEGLRRISKRLQNVPGFTDIRYEPSRIRPRTVVATVDVEMFLGRAFPRTEATVEVTWRAREGTDVQRVQWIDETVSLGWHKDDDHPALGTTHFQIDSEDESDHEPAHIEAEAPLHFLEICLDRLPDQLAETIE